MSPTKYAQNYALFCVVVVTISWLFESIWFNYSHSCSIWHWEIYWLPNCKWSNLEESRQKSWYQNHTKIKNLVTISWKVLQDYIPRMKRVLTLPLCESILFRWFATFAAALWVTAAPMIDCKLWTIGPFPWIRLTMQTDPHFTCPVVEKSISIFTYLHTTISQANWRISSFKDRTSKWQPQHWCILLNDACFDMPSDKTMICLY